MQRAYCESLSPSGETGYVDPGWSRRPTILDDDSLLIDSHGRRHQVGELTAYVPNSQELRGISVIDLRQYLGLPIRRSGGVGKTTVEHARSRCISGCLRHSGSMIPNDGDFFVGRITA